MRGGGRDAFGGVAKKAVCIALAVMAIGAGAAEARRARGQRVERRQKRMSGLVAMETGKTAGGEKTRLYRLMGDGGMAADFSDYGARLVRAYAPDGQGDLAQLVEGGMLAPIDCEKAGKVYPVWEARPLRRPRAIGLEFRIERDGETGRAAYWLDAENRITVETDLPPALTNALGGATLRADGARKATGAVKAGEGGKTAVMLRNGTNRVQRAVIEFMKFAKEERSRK